MAIAPAIIWKAPVSAPTTLSPPAFQLQLLDQRRLPHEVIYLTYSTHQAVAEAISLMVVRGAPAIGITAAYGMALAVQEAYAQSNPQRFLQDARARLAESRPTAVNLMWALKRLDPLLAAFNQSDDYATLSTNMAKEAVLIHEEDLAANHLMGQLGAELIQTTGRCDVLTHCNAGSLATGGYGTALGVIRSAFEKGLIGQVYVDETRPWLQGARLTAWELLQDAIPACLIADVAAAHVMRTKNIGWVIVGADRIAANGDTANKIGTCGLAVIAKYYGVKMMVVAPSSTIDFELPDGSQVPIEERPADEVRSLHSLRIAPAGVGAFNPVFDITPASLIDVIVTEKGVVLQPGENGMLGLRKR